MFFFHLIFIIIVFFLSHPIRLRISLILIAILARIISLWINSSWFFYLIVLVFYSLFLGFTIHQENLNAIKYFWQSAKQKNILNNVKLFFLWNIHLLILPFLKILSWEFFRTISSGGWNIYIPLFKLSSWYPAFKTVSSGGP